MGSQMHEGERPEIFIGLIGAVGIDLGDVGDMFGQVLAHARYDVARIRVSACLIEILGMSNDETSVLPEDQRVRRLQDEGDRLRRMAKNGAAAMWPAIAELRRIREATISRKADCAYVIQSLKRPEEVRLLREIYGENFIAVGCVASLRSRKDYLKRMFERDAGYIGDADNIEGRVSGMIARDDADEDNELGQNVRDTMALSDAFISMDEEPPHDALRQIERICHALLGSPWVVPSSAEYAMTIAATAAARSQDLSRQVGAVIVDRNGMIVATGFNEVPVPGGGTDWSDVPSHREGRDRRSGDANAYMRRTIFREFVEAMHESGLLRQDIDIDSMVENMLSGTLQKTFKKRRVSNLIEFGRIVHAEMTALTDAARTGRAVAGATLYCTTYPCHMCARHLIAAGIARVVYIEPYPKSLTRQLYAGAVVHDDEAGASPNVLRFVPFIGITPRLYDRVFQLGNRRRKDGDGRAIPWQADTSMPLIDNREPKSYVKREIIQVVCLNSVIHGSSEPVSGGGS